MTLSINQLLDRLLQFLRTRRGKIVLSLGISLLVIITLLPHGISYGVRDWLHENGADETNIKDVDFNLFTGRLEFNDLRITVAQDYTLVLAEAFINIDWLPLFSKQFQIKEVFVENTDITLEQRADGKMVIGGVTSPPSPAKEKPADDSKPWGLGLDKLTIVNSKLYYVQPQLDLALHIDNASLTGLQSREQAPAQFTLAGNVNGSPLQIDSHLAPFAAQPSFNADINLQSLALADFTRMAQPRVNSLAGALSLNGHVIGSYRPGKGAQINNSGELTLHDLDITDSNLHIKSGAFAWSGTVQADLPTDGSTPQLTLEGGMTAGKLVVRDVQAQADVAALLDIDAVKLAELLFDNNGLHISSINVQQLQASLLRNAEGKIALLERLTVPVEAPAVEAPAPEAYVPETPVAEAPAAEEPVPETEPARGPTIRIDDIQVGENSSFTFEDMSTQPAFKSVVHLNSVKLSGLDSSQPEQAASFAIDGKVGKFSTLTSEGKVYPFLPQFGLNMTSALKAVELPPLTSYTSGIMGYKLMSGQLQADIKVDIKDNKLDGESELVLNSMDVLALTPEEKKAINTTADMSLELGLAMLRDKKNNIKLSLPFKGDLNDPKFDISDAINQAIGKAIRTTGMSFLKVALQPFGTILMVAEIASSAAGAVQLQPVIFTAGSTTIDATALQYQERLAGLLNERPQLRIKICGVATSSDRDDLVARELDALKAKQTSSKRRKDREKPIPTPVIADERLLELAMLRADAIKGVLISRYQLGADRLFSCHPQIDANKDAVPRVELGI